MRDLLEKISLNKLLLIVNSIRCHRKKNVTHIITPNFIGQTN